MNSPKLLLSVFALLAAIGVYFATRPASESAPAEDRFVDVSEAGEGAPPAVASESASETVEEQRSPIAEAQRKEAAEALRDQALKLLEQARSDRESQPHYEEAFAYMQQAAEGGSVAALKDLAYMAERGLGVEKSAEAALEFYFRAAELGDAEAMLEVGDFLDGDRGVRTNYLLAAEWYAEAAAGGVAEASARLGQLYAAGRGVEQDYAMAMELYREAAAGGSSKGNLYLGLAHLEGWGVEANVDSAMEFIEKAAGSGDAQAQYALYKIYMDGERVAADETVALDWLRRSVMGGDDESLRAYMKEDGARGQELLEAIDLLGDLSDAESAAARFELARMSLKYDRSPSGVASALALAESAAAQGDRRANLMLASLSARFAEDPRMSRLSGMTRPAEDWLAAGAAAEDPRSVYALRLMEREGYGASQAIAAAHRATPEEMYKYGSRYNAEKSGEFRPPTITDLVAASYPEGLQLQDFTGQVVVELVVSESGEVVQSRVVNQEHPDLSQAALSAVSQWRFDPALKDGRPTSTAIRVPVRFTR